MLIYIILFYEVIGTGGEIETDLKAQKKKKYRKQIFDIHLKPKKNPDLVQFGPIKFEK